MKTILMIMSKINLLHKATSPGVSLIVITSRCHCNGACKCKNKEG